jgi:hypothetical protein
MPILRIEHRAADFDAWKQAFDNDPLDREGSGVRRYRVLRSLDDPNYVMVDLEFDDAAAAQAMHSALQELWCSLQSKGLIGDQQARLVDVIEANEY